MPGINIDYAGVEYYRTRLGYVIRNVSAAVTTVQSHTCFRFYYFVQNLAAND